MEVQVALIVFMVGITGIVPLTVMNTRQMVTMRDRVPDGEIQYLVRPDTQWTAKLGMPASLDDTAPSSPPQAVYMIDDGDAGFTLEDYGTWDWYSYSHANAFQTDYHVNNGGRLGDQAHWQFALAPGRYEIFVTYPAIASNAKDSPYRVLDGTTQLSVVRINQQKVPKGPTYGGQPWDSLGQFVITSGTLRVNLYDSANGNIAADAVRVVPLRNEVQVLTVQKQPDTQEITVHATVTP